MDRQMHRQVSRHKNRIETNKQTGRQAGRHAAGTIIEPSYGSFKHFVHLFFFYINTQKKIAKYQYGKVFTYQFY